MIAPTAQTHAKLAILAALRTWPHLKENPVARVACNDNVNDDNNNWLMNKMMALSHLHMPSSMGCERVLLARMLLEEQQLDEQRSVGKRGKYASKFHPSTSYDTDTNNNNNNNSKGRHTRSNTIGSRPLTVGEISVNWSEGACLLDTLSVRYHVNNGQNPMPIIRECLQELISSSSSSSSSTNCMLYENVTRNAQIALQELLSHCCANSSNEVFIVLPHKCYLDAAVRLLSSSSFDTNKQKSNDSNNLNVNLRVGTTDALLQRKQQTNANVVDDIIQRYPNGRIDLSLPTIQIVYPDDEQQAGEENEKSDGMDAVAERLVRGVVDCDHVFCVGDYNVLSNVKSRVIGADRYVSIVFEMICFFIRMFRFGCGLRQQFAYEYIVLKLATLILRLV